MSNWEIKQGDWIDVLRTLPDESVQCCTTSPPYWGLRDYGVEGQLGLERTPEEYVAKMVEGFREIRRVLRNDGVLWLNLGDSYSSGGRATQVAPTLRSAGKDACGGKQEYLNNFAVRPGTPDNCKAKDLIGIPWAVAAAMRDPYYSGKIKRERDRVWMAAIIDAEGSICGFNYQRPDHTETHRSIRTGIHITITNSSMLMLDEAQRIWRTSRSEHNRHGRGHLGKLDTFRWIPHGIENKMLLIRELYPYLIVKQRQAMVAYTLLSFMTDAKRLGKTPERFDVWEKRKRLTEILSSLNQQRSVDLPDWLIEPPSVTEPGWYLRQDIIWSKPNPMPESVRDRCTKSHEYIFLMSKSERYYYDQAAIAESSVTAWEIDQAKRQQRVDATGGAITGGTGDVLSHGTTRNKRSVWTVTTQGYSEAHFATFPTKLVEPCILAGSSEHGCCSKCGAPWERVIEIERSNQSGSGKSGNVPEGKLSGGTQVREDHDIRLGPTVSTQTIGWEPSCECKAEITPCTILDPFNGSGTTGLVATRLNRNYVGIELNPEYVTMAKNRIVNDAPLFNSFSAVGD
jgi:DNA modification methylase